ncbi:MAG: hypothetical protein Q9159_001955 [Coniocarpon cinnabarinum]
MAVTSHTSPTSPSPAAARKKRRRVRKDSQRRARKAVAAKAIAKPPSPLIIKEDRPKSSAVGTLKQNVVRRKRYRPRWRQRLARAKNKKAKAAGMADARGDGNGGTDVSVQPKIENPAGDGSNVTSPDNANTDSLSAGSVARDGITRPLPNIAISGTPGTGKTTLAQTLVKALNDVNLPFTYLDFANTEASQPFRESFDEDRQSWIIDEEGLAAHLSPGLITKGGQIIDWIHADMFEPAPGGPIDLVLTVRVRETSILYDRLVAREYRKAKVGENMDAEIMGCVWEENLEAFERRVGCWEVHGDEQGDRAKAVERVVKWVREWILEGEKDKGQDG